MPARQLQLGFEVMPTEADLRAAFQRTSLAMPFDKAMQRPAISLCLHAMARAALTGKTRGGRRARGSPTRPLQTLSPGLSPKGREEADVFPLPPGEGSRVRDGEGR